MKQLWPSIVIAIAGVVCSIGGYLYSRNLEDQNLRNFFFNHAQEKGDAISLNIESKLLLLESIHNLFLATGDMERDDFHSFVDPFTRELEGVRALEWVPRISNEERHTFETQLQSSGNTGFFIKELDEENRLVRSQEQVEYFPVIDSESNRSIERVSGFDLASEPTRFEALSKARSTGKPTVTAPLRLVQSSDSSRGVQVFMPLYAPGMPTESPSDRERYLSGFIVGVFHITEMIDAALSILDLDDIRVKLYDTTSPDSIQILYTGTNGPNLDVEQQFTTNDNGYPYLMSIHVKDRIWTIVCDSTPEFLASQKTSTPTLILLAGLIITGLFSLYVATNARYARRLAESNQSLLENQKYLNETLTMAPIVVWATDTDGVITFSQGRGLENLNLSETEIAGHSIYGYLGNNKEISSYINRALTGEDITEVYEIQGRRWLCHFIPRKDDAGRIIGMSGTSVDITEKLKNQSEINKLSKALEESPNEIFIFDVSTFQFTYCNQGALENIGYSLNEMKEMTPVDIKPNYSREDFEALLQPLLNGEKPKIDFETNHQRKDGTTYPVELRLSLSETDDEKFFLAVGMDMSSHRLTANAIHEIVVGLSSDVREEFLSSLVKNLANSLHADTAFVGRFTSKNLDEIETLAVYMDGESSENFSYTLEHTPCNIAISEGFCLYPENVATHFPNDQMLIDMKSEGYIGVVLKGSKGQQLGVLAALFNQPIAYPDVAESIVQIFAARTGAELELLIAEEERERLERQIQHAQKLESLGVLAGGIAHDFNNLLLGILGNADLALLHLSPSATGREHVEEIVTISQRAADLCKQMLAYSGKGRFVVKAVSLSDVVEDMAHLLEVSISKRAVIKYAFDQNLPAVEVDVTQVRQVIMNLITNASDAVGERSGIITIGTGAQECDHHYFESTFCDDDLSEGIYIYMEVSDTGCGMDEDIRSRIFDPFFTSKETGRGLGMAAVLGIVRGHRGAVKVYSESGRGTSIKILFPASEQPIVPIENPQDKDESWHGDGTILVVDDDATIRALTKRILELGGFDVLTASDGREGVDMFREHRDKIKAVLLDMTMPRLNGEEAFQEMRQIQSDVKVVLTSGYNEQDATNRFAGKGLAAFIQKPYQAKELMAIFRQVLGD